MSHNVTLWHHVIMMMLWCHTIGQGFVKFIALCSLNWLRYHLGSNMCIFSQNYSVLFFCISVRNFVSVHQTVQLLDVRQLYRHTIGSDSIILTTDAGGKKLRFVFLSGLIKYICFNSWQRKILDWFKVLILKCNRYPLHMSSLILFVEAH